MKTGRHFKKSSAPKDKRAKGPKKVLFKIHDLSLVNIGKKLEEHIENWKLKIKNY